MYLPEIKQLEDSDKHILYIEELRQVRKAHSEFTLNKTDMVVSAQFISCLNAFFIWYAKFRNQVIKGKKYSDDQIADNLLSKTKKGQQSKTIINMQLYVSIRYIDFLAEHVNTDNLQRYDHTISSLLIDLEDLITSYMIHVQNLTVELQMQSWQYRYLRPRDSYMGARTMFYIEEQRDIESLYLRDLKPVVIFQMRQTIEEYGKYILGIGWVENKNGTEIQNLAGYVWDFLLQEIKKSIPNITFPFDARIIWKIYTWACDYVHTSYIYSSYFQHFILQILSRLFVSYTEGLLVYSNRIIRKYDVSEVKIFNYSQLKADFESFIQSKKSKDGPLSFAWYEIDSVGAYVISQ